MIPLSLLLAPLDLNRLSPADAATIQGLPVVASVFVADPPDTQFGVTYFGDDTGFVPKTVYLPGEHDVRRGDRVTVFGTVRLVLHRPDRWFRGFVEVRVDAVRILSP
jgi:hypothetical protein